jgi:hypothetical protein
MEAISAGSLAALKPAAPEYGPILPAPEGDHENNVFPVY